MIRRESEARGPWRAAQNEDAGMDFLPLCACFGQEVQRQRRPGRQSEPPRPAQGGLGRRPPGGGDEGHLRPMSAPCSPPERQNWFWGGGCVSLHSPRRMIKAGADPKVPGVEDGAQAQGTVTLSLWVQSPAMMRLAPGEAEAPSACSLPCP